MSTVTVKTAAWYGDRDVDLTFPEDWNVETAAFESRPVLTDEQLADIFANPVGTPRISEMARGRKSAVILVDDLTRPTPASRVMPFIIEQLVEAGIDEGSILIFIAHGCHRMMHGPDKAKKVGVEVARNFPIRQNEMDDAFINVGTTSYGVPVEVNQWVMDCEFKIGVGGPTPHGTATFSGGGKIVIPGCCSHRTNRAAHSEVGHKLGKGFTKAGKEMSPFRLNSEEAARMAGLDATCLLVLNNAREVTGAVVGDVVEAHRAAVEIARKAYAIRIVEDAEIVVATGYPRDHDINYSGHGLWPLHASNGATKVLVAAGSEGVGYHRMGIINQKNTRVEENREREEQSVPVKTDVPEFYFMSDVVGPAEVRDVYPNAELLEVWGNARDMLEDRYRGKTPKVAVYPSSAISYATA
tara:strand:+ start:8860 stop:10095 length:1236 start_codon:yes stop_codon:yes gene_type:complete